MTDIIKPSQVETEDVLATTMESIVAGLTGIASSERKELILTVGQIFQRARAHGFLDALMREWKEFQANGKVDPEYTKSEQHKACLQELLDFLDKDSPDQIRFDAIGVCTSLPTTPHLVVGRSACRVGVGPSLNRSWAQRSRPVVQAGRRAFPGDESVVD